MGVSEVPNIVGFTMLSGTGKIRLSKRILALLGATVKTGLRLCPGSEVILTATGKGEPLEVEKGNTITLPHFLESPKSSKICFLERAGGLALKSFEVREEIAESPSVVDYETAKAVTRIMRTFPEPDLLIHRLEPANSGRIFREKLLSFWRDRNSPPSVVARRLLGTEEPKDRDLRNELRDRIRNTQQPDGSFGDSVIHTCRCVEDLLDYGSPLEEPGLRRAADWLLSRPRSDYNPGMFFLSDDLVHEQARIIVERRSTTRGPRPRFRERKKPELRAVEGYDPLFTDNVCGPRIMWPNGIVLHALLRLGMEGHQRIQRLMETLASHEWCECGFQHGNAEWRRNLPLSKDELVLFENQARRQFCRGGLAVLSDLADEYRVTRDLLRYSQTASGDHDEYAIMLPAHIQSCEYMTVFGASRASHPAVRAFAEAHLWRFAGLLYSGFAGNLEAKPRLSLQERHFAEVAYFLLRIFSEYHHPAARLGINLAIPWLHKNQNDDGSWGAEPYVESATLAVTTALDSIDLLE